MKKRMQTVAKMATGMKVAPREEKEDDLLFDVVLSVPDCAVSFRPAPTLGSSAFP